MSENRRILLNFGESAAIWIPGWCTHLPPHGDLQDDQDCLHFLRLGVAELPCATLSLLAVATLAEIAERKEKQALYGKPSSEYMPIRIHVPECGDPMNQ